MEIWLNLNQLVRGASRRIVLRLDRARKAAVSFVPSKTAAGTDATYLAINKRVLRTFLKAE